MEIVVHAMMGISSEVSNAFNVSLLDVKLKTLQLYQMFVRVHNVSHNTI